MESVLNQSYFLTYACDKELQIEQLRLIYRVYKKHSVKTRLPKITLSLFNLSLVHECCIVKSSNSKCSHKKKEVTVVCLCTAECGLLMHTVTVS